MGLAPQWCQRLVFLCYVEHAPCWVSNHSYQFWLASFQAIEWIQHLIQCIPKEAVLVTQCREFFKFESTNSRFKPCTHVRTDQDMRMRHLVLACMGSVQIEAPIQMQFCKVALNIYIYSKTVTVAMLLFCTCVIISWNNIIIKTICQLPEAH